jgi:hypothetical protein
MSEWIKFLGPFDSLDERVVGTYLYPYRLFMPVDYEDPYASTEVMGRVPAGAQEVMVTRNGGLFVQPPDDLPLSSHITEDNEEWHKTFLRKVAIEDEATSSFNLVICELALLGFVSEPASTVHLSVGKLVDDHALITSSTGGREMYPERTIQRSHELLSGQRPASSLGSGRVPEGTFEKARLLERANKLAEVAELLPTLVAGAYSMFSRRQLGEALLDSWGACEQLLDYLWREYVSSLSNDRRRERLRDTRTYTAVVRTETLFTAGLIDLTVYDALNTARKQRNDMAHRAKITLQGAEDGTHAMKLMIELLCKTNIEPPLTSTSINW